METIKEKLERLKRENPVSPKIERHYDVVGVIPGVVAFGHKSGDEGQAKYDLRTIDKETADRLFKAGFPYLKPKSGTASSTVSTTENSSSKKS